MRHETRGEAYATLTGDLERAAAVLADGATSREWKTYRKAIDALASHESESRSGADDMDSRGAATGVGPFYVARNESETCTYSLLTYGGRFAPDYRVIPAMQRRAVPTDRELLKILAAATQVTRATYKVEGEGWSTEYAVPDPRMSDGWQVWQGNDFSPDGEPIDYKLPGQRKNRGKPRHDYLSFCTYPVDRRGHECGMTHTDRKGKRGWSCKVIDPRTGLAHGSEHVRGGYVASGLDDGAPERVTDDRGSLVPNTRGKYLRTGSRKTYAGRSRGKFGQVITERPSEPVMASGKWGLRSPDRWTKTDRRGSRPCAAILVYVGKVRTADGFKGKRLTKVLTAGGMVATTTPRNGFSSLVARDARAAVVLAEQVAAAKVEKTERSRSALVAAGAAARADDDLMARADAILNRRGVASR